MTGGSPVISYHLQRTPALGTIYTPKILDTFFDVGGASGNHSLSTEYTITDLEQGRVYAFRFRAININGAGPWSPTALLVPATVPAPPAAPKLVSATAS